MTIQGFYIKDIPLTVLRDYMSKEYIDSDQFARNSELYDALNSLHQGMTSISSDESYFKIYRELLIDLLALKYSGNYPQEILDERDIRRVLLELEGEDMVITDSRSVTESAKMAIPRIVTPNSITVEIQTTSENVRRIKEMNKIAKDQFMAEYEPENLLTENSIINIKNSLDLEKDPSYLNVIRRMNSALYQKLMSYKMINMQEIVESEEVKERIPRRKLESDYTALIELLILKYHNNDIEKLNAVPTVSDDIRNLLVEKHAEGYMEYLAILSDPSTLDPRRTRIDVESVEWFLGNNDLMQDYILVKD